MYLIVGLGNPEEEYSKTRHNMGFNTINKLSQQYNIDVKQKKFQALYGSGIIENEKVLLLKPQTYMNLSGNSVKEVVDFYKINNDKIEEIDSDVVMSSIKIGNDKLYYLKNQEDKYNLYVYDKKKATLLREKIDSYYIIGKNIYLLKDYKEADLNGSLYLYNKKKDKMIISKITALAEKNSN